jgi:nitrous oxidase accessory protein NosD
MNARDLLFRPANLRSSHFILLFHVFFFVFFTGTAHAREHRPSPGKDLGAVVAKAKSGDVIRLAAGEYKGQIAAVGKTVRIIGDSKGGTVLSSGKAQALVYAGPKGIVAADHITFRIDGKTEIAAFVKAGTLEMKDCRVMAAPKQALYVENGRLSVKGCRFEKAGKEAILAVKNAHVIVDDTDFGSMAENAVSIQGNCKAEITRSRFKNINKIAILGVQKSIISVEDSTFSQLRYYAVQVGRDSRLKVKKCRFRDLGKSALVGYARAILDVSNSRFENINSPAIFLKEGHSISVMGSMFQNTNYSMVVGGGRPDVRIQDNIIHDITSDNHVIWVNAGMRIMITDNTISHVKHGIGLKGALSGDIEVSDNLLVNLTGGGIYAELTSKSKKGPAFRGNTIINSADYGMLLISTQAAFISDNLIIARKKPGIVLQNNANARVGNNIVAGKPDAVYLHKTAGNRTSIEGGNLFIGGMRTDVTLTGNMDNKLNSMLMRSKGMEGMQSLVEQILQTVSKEKSPNVKKIRSLTANLNKKVAGLREQASKLASIKVIIKGRAGQPIPAGFTLLNLDGDMLAEGKDKGQTLDVMAGTYLVEPQFDPDKVKEITVKASEQAVVEIRAKELIGLNVEYYDSRSKETKVATLVVRLKDQADMRPMLRASRPRLPGVRRKAATDHELKQGLGLVEKRFSALIKDYKKADEAYQKMFDKPSIDFKAFNKAKAEIDRWDLAVNSAMRIFAVAGNEKTSKLLYDLVLNDEMLRGKSLATLAFMEKRTGNLDKGLVVKLTGQKDKNIAMKAAAMLHQYGSHKGDALLLDQLQKPRNHNNISIAVHSLIDMDSQQVLEGMRGVVRKYLELNRQAYLGHKGKGKPAKFPYFLWAAARPALMYLMAHGNSEDLSMVGRVPFEESDFRLLSGLLKDPLPLVEFYLGLDGRKVVRYEPAWVASLCPVIKQLPRETYYKIDAALLSALIRAARIKDVGRFGDDMDTKLAIWNYNVAKCSCMPNRTTGEFIFKKMDRFLGKSEWIQRPWNEDGLIKKFQAGDARTAPLLDHIAHEKLEKALGNGKAGSQVKYPDIFLAYHRIATRACLSDSCAFSLINSRNPPGVLLGVASIKPLMQGNKLSVHITMDLAAHQHGDLATMMDKPTRSFKDYLKSGGKTLIAGVYLKQGDQIIKMEPQDKTAPGGMVFEAALAKPDLHETYLYLDLKMFEVSGQVGYALFALQ